MKRVGIIETRLHKSHDFPNYARQVRGFRTHARGGDAIGQPLFKRIRIRGGNSAFKNEVLQCVIYAFKPGGIVQILKDENGALIGSEASSFGVANPNIAVYQGEDSATGLGYNTVFIPENPGIYTPQVSYSFTSSIGLPRSGAIYFSGLVRNDLIAGWVPGTTYLDSGYQTVPGIITTDRFRTRRNSYDIQDAPTWVGAQYVCTGWDKKTGANYTFQNSARPRFWKWFAGGAGNGVFTSVTVDDDAGLNALMGNGLWCCMSFEGGFVLSLYTNGAGPTGQRCEVFVCNAEMTEYYLLKFLPADTFVKNALVDTGTPFTTAPWQVVIDKYGILWMWFEGMTSPYDDAIVTSFEPIGWDIPFITYVPRASINLGCVNTCVPVNPAY